MLKSKEFEVRAIASRSLPTAKKWAKKLGIPVAYGSYEELLDDPEIDAVYNPLPNHLHVPLTLAAAMKGKHVLCEKPIALTAAEAETLRARAEGRAHRRGLHGPRTIRSGSRRASSSARASSAASCAIQSLFTYYNVDPDNVRNMADIGGGAAYDIGCYPIVVAPLHLRRRAGARRRAHRPRPEVQAPTARPARSSISAKAAT